MLLQEWRECLWQEFTDGGGVRKQGDLGLQSLGEIAKLAAHLLHLLQHDPRMMHDSFARRCRRNSASSPFQKRHADDFLHAAQACAGGWKRQVGSFGSVRDAASFDDGHE
ncbi:hypothetical protein GCM10010136_12240 [Limoniibacter endophyticus]|uniref:Uncharacterized protein n=1 Tax=Limoniibacter endophyticus TaxID=1565040 RepID=A0A8J3DHD3_9HYPH|nr:hypothetical protein GCM10010136_12240 [Limoniibacter endophyticus]